MRFELDSKQRSFFASNHFIEFDEIIPQETVTCLKTEIDAHFTSKRLTSKDFFLRGRNLLLPTALKLSCDRNLARLMGDLLALHRLRLAYTQIFYTSQWPEQIFGSLSTIEEISCFQDLAGGILIRLTPDDDPVDFFPKTVGGALFFSRHCQIPWAYLTEKMHQSFFLIAYGSLRTVYVFRQQDPHTHLLKAEGYSFGDVLKTPFLTH